MLKCLRLAGALALGLASPALAGSHTDGAGTKTDPVTPIYAYASAGADQMALAVATNTTLAVPPNATLAQICVQGAAVRYRDSGSAATATLGLLAAAGQCFAYTGPLAALSFTAVSGSPTLDVSYYKAN